MNQKRTESYTIRRSAGGCYHFARVTVSYDDRSLESPRGFSDACEAWRNAARSGVKYAVDIFQSELTIHVVLIEGTISDTLDGAVYTAAAVAALKLLGMESASEQFQNDHWEVSLGAIDGDGVVNEDGGT